MKVQGEKKKLNLEREHELRDKFEALMEADAKLKAEKERKKREHEEDMFLLDLKKAEEAEQAQGEAMQRKMKEI